MLRILALAVLSAGLITPAYAQDAYLTLEELIALKRVTSVRMNPAGDLIAYTLSVPRTPYEDDDGPAFVELHVTDLKGNSRPFVMGDVKVSSVRWAADGRSIYYLAKRDEEDDVNAIYEIALAGGESIERFSHVSSITAIFPSPDGTRIAFTAPEADPEREEDLQEKGFKAVVYEESKPNVNVWMLDLDAMTAEQHELDGSASDLAWDPDGERYAVALAPTPLVDDAYTSRDVYVVGADSGRILNALGSAGKLGDFEFSPDGERIAYIGSVDINDPKDGRLYVASASGGERREVVPNYFGHVADFVWNDALSIKWLGNRGVWREWETTSITDTKEAGEPPSSGPIIRRVHGHPGQAVTAAVADTPAHPPEVYLLREGAAPERLSFSNPILEERSLARQEVIRYDARDGLAIEAMLIHPVEKQRGGNPLIVIAHGGPESNYSNGWLSRYANPGQVFAAQGFAVVYPNYRGSTGRGVTFSKLSQNDYAEEEFNDLVDAKRHLVAEGIADPDRVGITGGSYGGYASMWSASALSEEYAAAVASVGISNQISKFGTGDIPYEMYNVHSRMWPWDDWMWLLRRSPIYHAGKTRTPLLIMHGEEDPRVHPGQSLEMYRFVKIRTDTPVRLVTYPDEGHGNSNTAARYDFGLRLMRWMQHYLVGPGGEPPPYDLGHADRLPESDD